MNEKNIERMYEAAKERYAELGIDADAAAAKLADVSISIHCWQADDVAGLEGAAELSGGIAVTGAHGGKPRGIEELREDLEKAMSLIPERHRINLHAISGDFSSGKADRNEIEPKHFDSWIDWADDIGVGLDFNATCFSHPRAAEGYTLASLDEGTRSFWIEHVARCREIAEHIGARLKSPCLHNLWIPDGCKDITLDRYKRRELLKDSLDKIYAHRRGASFLRDSVESKLFGIGSESFVVGSHEFYMGYALKNNLTLCLDMGHFHPTESVADKVSSTLLYFDELALHVSRPVRWDSDHVAIYNDDLTALFAEIVRAGALEKTRIALDYFDGSINRVGAYAIGARAALAAILAALLEPTEEIRRLEEEGNGFAKLAMLEELKRAPFGAVWDYYCLTRGAPVAEDYIAAVNDYEKNVLAKRI